MTGVSLMDERNECVNLLVRRLEWLRYMREHAEYVIATGSYKVGIVENLAPAPGRLSAYGNAVHDRDASTVLCMGLASCTDVPRGIDAAIRKTQEDLQGALVEMERECNRLRDMALALLGEVQP